MEVAIFHPSIYSYLFPHHLIHFWPQNYVHWVQTPESHVYSRLIYQAGVRKEEIKVEVEDSMYLMIRTEAEEPHRSFSRKFRLPVRVDVGGISAEYVDGVLTVKVPRSYITRRGLPIHTENLLARAA